MIDVEETNNVVTEFLANNHVLEVEIEKLFLRGMESEAWKCNFRTHGDVFHGGHIMKCVVVLRKCSGSEVIFLWQGTRSGLIYLNACDGRVFIRNGFGTGTFTLLFHGFCLFIY